jgi:hypothetical protein
MTESFEAVVNETVVVREAEDGKPEKTQDIAMLMGEFCDNVLKNKFKLSDDETLARLDDCVQLFAHLQEKDVFQGIHQAMLAKRLLLYEKVNVEWERAMIQKLKVLAGAHFTNKMEKMVVDHGLQDALKENFETVHPDGEFEGMKMDVEVFQRSHWPQYSSTEVVLPRQIKSAMDMYETFYATTRERTTLRWIHSLCKVSLKLNFVDGTQPEVQVSMIQASILLLFNDPDSPKLTAEEVCKRLNMVGDKYTKNCLEEMAILDKKHPEYQFLSIEQAKPSSKVHNEDVLSLNKEGLDKLVKKKKLKRRYGKPMVSMKIDGADEAELLKQIQRDRVMTMDACIVKIMKARSEMKRSQLVMAVCEELNKLFRADPKFVKTRIEKLTDPEHEEGQILKPDDADPELLKYMAGHT